MISPAIVHMGTYRSTLSPVTVLGPIDAKRTLPAMGYRVGRLVSKYFRSQLHDAENIPSEGPALLVGNHALLGIDSFALFPEIYHVSGRVPRGLGLRNLFRVPLLRDLLHEVGAVAGERETAIELLHRGELCICYPGGVNDSLKGTSERHRLQWGARTGFARVALMSGAPVVPVAAIGPDDAFIQMPGLPSWGAGFLGSKSYRAPVFIPVARPVRFDYFFGPPIEPPARPTEPEALDAAVTEFAAQVRRTLESLLEDGQRRRDETTRSR